MNYDLHRIMGNAWRIQRKYAVPFGEALHRAWQCVKLEEVNKTRIGFEAVCAGIEEEVNTWAGWREKGFEVRHGEKARFSCLLLWPSKGDTAQYKASFFGASQVQAIQ